MMVQKKEKVAKNAKPKTTPSIAKPLKTKKSNAAPLTNGYKNGQSHEKNMKKKTVNDSDNTTLTEAVASSSDVSSNKTEITPLELSKEIQNKAPTSKMDMGDSSNKNEPSTSNKVENSSNSDTVVKIPRSIKRKIPAVDEANTDKKTLSKNKTKAKKQKIQLQAPILKSIPGKVFVIGDNDVGQLGLEEEIECKEKPFLLDLPYPIVDIAAGGMHSVCLTENGEVLTFGCNDEGALGRVTQEEEERIPQKVNIPEKIVKVSAGDSHSAALAESGQVYLWGNFRNGQGQMGLTRDGKYSIVPVKILMGVKVVKIASGGDHLVCLSEEGIVYTCGCGEQGQLGRINPRVCQDGGRKGLAALLEPAPVDQMSRVAVDDVWTESYATFLKVRETGSICAFGLNNYNQLGFQNKSEEQEFQMKFFPQLVSSFSNKSWQQINGGQHHTLALDTEGLVHSMGRKDYGRLGLGEDCEETSVPTAIPTLQNEKCSSVSCGNCVSFAVTEQGSVYSWGMGSNQLGQGSDEDIHSPQLIKGELLNSWKVHKVSGGGQHALILACPKKGTNKKT